MKRFGTVLLLLFSFTALTAYGQAKISLVQHAHPISTTAASLLQRGNSNVSPVFLSSKDGGFLPLASVEEADSNYTDTTSNGNGWYVFDVFGDTIETTQFGLDTLYNKGIGEIFYPSSIAKGKAYIDSVRICFIPYAFSPNDSLLVIVRPVWDQATTGGTTLPFINYYGQTSSGGNATSPLAEAVILPDSLVIGPGNINTVTARFPGTKAVPGKPLGSRTQFAVIVQDQGPDVINDTLQFVMEADLNTLQNPYTPDTTMNMTYWLQLTANNNVETQAFATDIPQLDNTGAQTGQSFYGNAVMIAYLHGLEAGVNEIASNGYALEGNYPNPVSTSTSIGYMLPTSSPVSLKVYNQLGEEVGTVVNSIKGAGPQTASFDAGNLPDGMYYYKLQAGDFTATKTMVIAR